MKLMRISAIIAVLFFLVGSLSAQTTLSKKEKKEIAKMAKKEAKNLTKQGYTNIVGDLPAQKQLEESYKLQYARTDKGAKKYYLTNQVAKAETFAAAKQQAFQLCVADIATQIGSNLIGRIKSNVANAESSQDAASITEVIGAYQNNVAAKIGRVDPIVVLKKEDDGLTYISMHVAYDTEAAAEMIKQDLRKELREKANLQQDEIDGILDIR